MTDNQITLGRLLSETAHLNYQLLQLQIDRLECELIPYIDPLQKMLKHSGKQQITSENLSLPVLHAKLTRLHHLKFELNQTEQLCRIAA
ncbi:MAG: hypothetical protein A2W80_10925 [Candidatus Riflebacteria bacterium GWC2_50_8]|nr:MAG: hypothetical protein A2W80_10925 [Candidatus Riflebacteria bacterium GWC2_50_8]